MALHRYMPEGINNPVFPQERKTARVWVVEYGPGGRRRSHMRDLFWLERDAIARVAELKADAQWSRYGASYRRSNDVLERWDYMTVDERTAEIAHQQQQQVEIDAENERMHALAQRRRAEIHNAVQRVLRPDHCTLELSWTTGRWRCASVIVLIDIGNYVVRAEVEFPEDRKCIATPQTKHQPARVQCSGFGNRMHEDELQAGIQGIQYAHQLQAVINSLGGEWPDMWR